MQLSPGSEQRYLSTAHKQLFRIQKMSFHSASNALMLGTFGIPWPYLAMKEGDVMVLNLNMIKSNQIEV